MLQDLRVELEIETTATPRDVWDALVNPAKIKQYLFGTDAISEWKKGASLRFTGSYEGSQYEDKGTILQFEKEKLFEYNYWSSFSPLQDAPENYAVITFSLKPAEGGTNLHLVHRGFAGEEQRRHSEENWAKVLQDLVRIAQAG